MSAVRTSHAAIALIIVSLAAPVLSAATRYDPRLKFRTISTARFDIHFHQGGDAVARRLASFVEAEAAKVERTVGVAVGRVQVVLVDQHDLSNGWATPLPYNTIEISTAAPSAESSIGNTGDWLRLVFVHEFTHIAHLSRAGGWIGGLRRGFGRLPVLFPNLYQPIWGIEGIATWQESASTAQGRLPAGDFRQLIERAAGAGRFEPIDRTGGGNVDWPSGATPYVYGAYFHEYLAGRYGAESLRKLTEETSRRLPYFGSRAYRTVFGRSLGQLWEEFAASTRERARRAADDGSANAVRLTHHGFNVSAPRFARDGRVFYSAVSPHHFPALMEIRTPGLPRRIASRYLGNAIAVSGDRLIVDELDVVRNVGLKSDLYEVNPADGSRRRLTREARASDPDISRSGVVVCVVQLGDRRALATFTPRAGQEGTPEILVSEPFTTYAAPRWSPDSRLIAAERRSLGASSQIVIIDPATRAVRVIADIPGGRSGAPAWMPDGRRILFSSAEDGEPFRIYSVDTQDGAISRLEGTGPSAQSPDVSADGESLVFVGYTVDGYDLFSMPLARARWRAAPAYGPPRSGLPQPVGAIDQSAPAIRAYSAWRTLAPHFWTPTLESDAGELVAGAATGSIDALGRHAYGIEAGWSSRARPDWQVAYAYDRWLPTIFAAVSDDTDPWRAGEVRTRELDIGTLLRISRVRLTQAGLLSFHAEKDSLECAPCDPPVQDDATRASIRLGWDVSSAKSFGYSISAEEGSRASLTAESTRRALGADANGFAATVDARHYWRAWPRHGVIALRGAAAGSWGDSAAVRRFSAAGAGPQPAGFRFGTDAIGLLRGFEEDDVIGTRAAVFNGDYRMPLARIDRGIGTLPLFIRSVHGAAFVDAGSAWTESARWSDLRLSLGAELSMDTVIGFALPVTFTAGGAWRAHGTEGERRFAAFARIGRAF